MKIYKINKEEQEICVEMERLSGYISISGSNCSDDNLIRELILLLGVSQKDIDEKTP